MTKLCRGCAGTGIGQHVSPRTIAVLEHISYTWRLVPENPRRRARTIVVALRPKAAAWAPPVHQEPLAFALATVERLRADGFDYDEESAAIPLDPEWTCPWCHGTGTPQLSVGTLEAAMRA